MLGIVSGMDCKSSEEISILSRESIINEYQHLCNRYNELKSSDQSHLQEIHQLRRELQTALSGQNHLTSELEIINLEHSKEIEELQRKQREEVSECKERSLKFKSELELVENERESLQSLIEELKKGQIAEKEVTINAAVDNINSVYKDKFAQLEAEYDSLAEACELLKDELTDVSKMNLQHELKIADLEDRLLCAETNLESKRAELEEKNEMYEVAQEQATQLSAELNALRTHSDTANARGNSLFAEVDDQRQKMKALLVAQKAKFIEMKNELEQSQREMRKLKRENAAMYKEMEVCSHTFLNAEHHHTEKLNERIAELMQQNDAITKKLTTTQDCLNNSIKKDSKWLDPIVALCEKESNELRDQLYRCSLEKVSIAGTLRQCEEESSRWRFEALKSRCVIASREALLEENRIPFGAIHDIEKRVRGINNENVSPNIVCRPSMMGFKRRSITHAVSPKVVPVAHNVCNEAVPLVDASVSHPAGQQDIKEPNSNCGVTIKTEPETPPPVPKDFVEALKVETEKKPIDFSGVTFRKKMNSSNASFNNNSLRSSGILKPAVTSNISNDKKVKFDNESTVMNKSVEKPLSEKNIGKPASEKNEEKVVNAPKTAVKKRIFIPSKKPAKPITSKDLA
ncbi:Protein Spindly-B [Pseudolycoriella hygida]|uniref:Protein Spindly-B n=1 Tax=Pseudolycoriella hygida TaxID=35572 RepID=A0A9Q0MHJ5_9DIPT|nr:Protein Spindly-B [Pseudolycoriella hygida]